MSVHQPQNISETKEEWMWGWGWGPRESGGGETAVRI